jgi:poly-gamma-glutamate synthesis protein (capsule biosynthesis protein)
VEIPPEAQPGEELPDGAVEDHRVRDVQSVLDEPGDLSEERLARYRLAADRTRGFLYNRGAPGGDGLKQLSFGE